MKLITIFILNVVIALNAFAQTAGDWSELGPKDFPPHLNWQLSGVARISQMKFHPTDPNTLYAVNSMGGLFVSHNKGQDWQNYGTDKLPQSRAASVCIDYSDDRIVYFSTGDPSYDQNSVGIWKTTDGGTTWKQITTGIGTRLATEMLMSPFDHNVVIAATNDGIWKTTNGGASWVQKKTGGKFNDMVFKPVPNTSTIYAAGQTDFWRSTNMGETWSQIALPSTGGLSGGGRVAVSKADTSVVYLTYVGDFAAGTSTPVLKSINGGTSFKVVRSPGQPNMNGYAGTQAGQGNYNFAMSANPNNANQLFIVGHLIWKSLDGGVTWTQVSIDWAHQVHTDMRQIPFSPYVADEVYNINDGGIWRSWDSGQSWLPICNGLMGTESYIGCQSPLKKKTISIGAQDNGEFVYRDGIWYINGAGDYHSNIVHDKLSPDYYYDLNYPGRKRSLPNGGSTTLAFPAALNDGSVGQKLRAEFPESNTSVGFISYKDVFVSTNIARNPPIWTQITNLNVEIKALATSPTDANTLYVVTSTGKILRSDNALATKPTFTTYNTPSVTNNTASLVVLKNNDNIVYLVCNNKVYRSVNKGATWTNITSNLPSINYHTILNDQFSPNEAVYIAGGSYVLYKDNTMTNWVNYSKGLPSVVQTTRLFMYNDGTDNSELTAVTAGRGVFHTGLYGKTSVLRIPEDPTAIIPGIVYKSYTGTWKNLPNFNSLVPDLISNTDIPSAQASSHANNFGLVFEGFIDAPQDGKYTFYLNASDGVQFMLGSDQVVYSDGIFTTPKETTGYAWLKKGKHKFTINYFNATSTKNLVFSWEGPGFTKQVVPAGSLYRLSPISECPGNGSIMVERWNNIAGTAVSAIPVSSTPSVKYYNPNFESKTDDGDNFGVRYRGYICPPYTGNYVFYVSSDDYSELYLSTDGNPAKKNKIAYLNGSVNQRNWFGSTTQKSAIKHLEAGQKYYVEALHKEGGGGDHFAVAWDMPSGEFQAPISGKHLSPYVTNTFPTVDITTPVDSFAILENNNIPVSATAADSDGTISKVEFFLDNIKAGTDSIAPFEWTWASAKAQSVAYSLTARATDDKGGVTVSKPKNVTVTTLRAAENPPSLKAGLDYKYYEGTWINLPDFSILTAVKKNQVANFDLSVRNRNDFFGIVYSGYIDIAEDGIYTFYCKSDEGTKLYIGNTLVVNNDGVHALLEKSGVIGLKAGKHTIRVEYFNTNTANNIEISYKGPSAVKTIVPNNVLFSDLVTLTPPSVSLSSNASSTIIPAAFTLTATADDTDGTIEKVEFYANGELIGKSSTQPYTFILKDLAAGAYTLVAKATDNSQLTAASTPITVTVTNNQMPKATLSAPVNNLILIKGSNVVDLNIAATATDADGTVDKVEFYNGAQKLGEVSNAPYTWSVSNVLLGTYNFTAKAYDNHSAAITSNSVNVSVSELESDITNNGGVFTAQYSGDGSELSTNLICNDVSKKYKAVTTDGTMWFQYKSPIPVVLTSYSYVSAENAKMNPEFNPKNWNIAGSNDGTTWTALDSRSSQRFTENFERQNYPIASKKAFTNFRVNITSANNGNTIQLAEWLLNGYEISLMSTDITDNGGTITAQYAASTANQPISKIIDNDATTNFSTNATTVPFWIQYTSRDTVRISKYSITSAGDSIEYSPRSWDLLASNDGTSWSTIDTRTSESFSTYYNTKMYSVNPTMSYKYYRLNMKANKGGGTRFKMAEWQMFDQTTSVEMLLADDICSVYPNPVINELHIDFKQIGDYQVEIFDIEGKLVYSKLTNSNTTINLVGAHSGICVLKITYNGKIYSTKFIKSGSNTENSN